jgi:hypothetical protein
MNAKIRSLSLLCDEFRFVGPSARLPAFRQSADFKEVAVTHDSGVHLRLSALERNRESPSLRCEFGGQSRAQESTTAAPFQGLSRTKWAFALKAEVGRSAAMVQNGLMQPMETVSANIGW